MFKKLLIGVSLLWVLTGCKSTIPMPVYQNQPVYQGVHTKSSMKSVETAIIKAALKLGWKPQVRASGEIIATLDIRKHHLVVLITHDENKLSVVYQDSTNLKYNGKKIHRQYANWVNNLLRAINTEAYSG